MKTLSRMEGVAMPVRILAKSRRTASTDFCMRSLMEFSSSMAFSPTLGLLAAVDQGADFLAAGGLHQVPGHVHVEHQDGDVVLAAERESGSIHHLELPVDGLGVGDGLVANGILMLVRILVVDPVHIG